LLLSLQLKQELIY